MGNYASEASPPKAAGEQFAEGDAAGPRPPLLLFPSTTPSSPKDQSDGELRERSEPAEGGGGRGREASRGGPRPPLPVAPHRRQRVVPKDHSARSYASEVVTRPSRTLRHETAAHRTRAERARRRRRGERSRSEPRGAKAPRFWIASPRSGRGRGREASRGGAKASEGATGCGRLKIDEAWRCAWRKTESPLVVGHTRLDIDATRVRHGVGDAPRAWAIPRTLAPPQPALAGTPTPAANLKKPLSTRS